MTARETKAKYFKSGAEFRAWLESNHDRASELLLGFYKKSVSKKGITYPEALDEALAFGWIDGVRRGVDEERYTIRFTPRKARSIWSNVNVRRVGELIAAGRMRDPGLATFAKRAAERSGIYSYEQRGTELPEEYEKILKKNKAACEFFYAQPAWYRKQAFWYIVSAKREETRLKRLQKIIDDSINRKRA